MNNKKELKDMINQNGFWLQINDIERIEKNAIKTKFTMPEGENILLFKGKASQAFKKGEVSRNEYKIDIDGWDLSAYRKNAQILLGHDANSPIGKTLQLEKSDDGLNITYFVDLEWMDEVNAKRMKGGAFTGLSTGHITHEMKFEDKKSGKRYDEKELTEKGVDIFWDIIINSDPDYVPVVTKAELVEISAVTLPSNPEALTMQNSLKHFFENQMTKLKKNQEEKTETEIVDDQAPQETPENITETPEETPTPGTDGEGEKETETPEGSENETEGAEATKTEGEEVTPGTDGENVDGDSEPEPKAEAETAEAKTEDAGDAEVESEVKTVVSPESKEELNALIAKRESDLADLKKLNNILTTEVEKNVTKEVKVDKEISKELFDVVENLAGLVINQGQQIRNLQSIIDSIPEQKGRQLTNQFAPELKI